jgi:hypothetical protein
VVDGKPKPFPDEAWNAKAGPPAQRWICVQSVVVDDQDALWVLDPTSPKTEAVVEGGPKLVKIDLATNKVMQTITLDENVAPNAPIEMTCAWTQKQATLLSLKAALGRSSWSISSLAKRLNGGAMAEEPANFRPRVVSSNDSPER